MLDELLEKLNALDLSGEFEIQDDKILWYYSMHTTLEYDEDQDHLWNTYAEVAETVRKMLPDSFKTDEAWQDNDSCGFEIKEVTT